ncbi:MAG: cation acetate symporter [Gammaproteobacteria bacterium]|nr:cation acetate symporter [Gammaproteobacteria bacterium]
MSRRMMPLARFGHRLQSVYAVACAACRASSRRLPGYAFVLRQGLQPLAHGVFPTSNSDSPPRASIRLPLALMALMTFVPGLAVAATDVVAQAATSEVNPRAVAMFCAFVVLMLFISWWAARRTHTRSEFYSAGGRITGAQNGVAIAGDFMSAASFLGISGLLFSFGYDGSIYAIGAFAAWPIIFFLLAERLHNLGRHTFIDVVTWRLNADRTRIISVISTLTIVVLYLIGQMVAAGALIELLFGISYLSALLIIGALVTIYVFFGGMLATTWVQIVKATLLLGGCALLLLLLLNYFDFSLDALMADAAKNHRFGETVMAPGNLYRDNVWQVLTSLFTMLFGICGLPHVLMRFYTVANMRQARLSALWATMIMGSFYLMLIIIGYGTIAVLFDFPELFVDGRILGSNNMVAVHLAGIVGGPWLAGFISAVAFATILAVVCGLTISASAAVSHDFYAELWCRGKPKEKTELAVGRSAIIVVVALAIVLGLLFENQNVAFITTLALVVSASVTFPVLMMAMYWKGLTSRGALYGACAGLSSSVIFIVLGPQVWVRTLGFAEPLFAYDYPGLFSGAICWAVLIIVSKMDRSELADTERARFEEMELIAEGFPPSTKPLSSE